MFSDLIDQSTTVFVLFSCSLWDFFDHVKAFNLVYLGLAKPVNPTPYRYPHSWILPSIPKL